MSDVRVSVLIELPQFMSPHTERKSSMQHLAIRSQTPFESKNWWLMKSSWKEEDLCAVACIYYTINFPITFFQTQNNPWLWTVSYLAIFLGHWGSCCHETTQKMKEKIGWIPPSESHSLHFSVESRSTTLELRTWWKLSSWLTWSCFQKYLCPLGSVGP